MKKNYTKSNNPKRNSAPINKLPIGNKEKKFNKFEETKIKAQKDGRTIELILEDLAVVDKLTKSEEQLQTKQLSNIKKLLQEGAAVDSKILGHAHKIKDQEILKLLCAQYTKTTKDYTTDPYLEIAVFNKDVKLVEELLRQGSKFLLWNDCKIVPSNYGETNTRPKKLKFEITPILTIGHTWILDEKTKKLLLEHKNKEKISSSEINNNHQSTDLMGKESDNNCYEYYEN
jgi:hypothetical protein